MSAEMERWSKLKIGTDLFVAKFDRKTSETEELYTFWLSDFKTLWSESVTGKYNLLQRLADDNPTLSISDEIWDQLLSALTTVESVTQVNKDIKPGEEEFKLQLQLSFNDGIASQFHWLLKKCDGQVFFDQITKSLLQQMCELNQLIDVVKSKDDEIRQHKLEGARPLERKRFITEVFNADEFKSTLKFGCAIDEFRAIVGPSPKNDTEKVPKVAIQASPKKPPNPNNRGARNRLLIRNQTLIKPGNVEYDASDDDDEDEPTSARTEDQVKPEDQIKTEAETNSEINTEPIPTVRMPTMPIPIPKKKIRRNFNLWFSWTDFSDRCSETYVFDKLIWYF